MHHTATTVGSVEPNGNGATTIVAISSNEEIRLLRGIDASLVRRSFGVSVVVGRRRYFDGDETFINGFVAWFGSFR
jgi:hypothetical protein